MFYGSKLSPMGVVDTAWLNGVNVLKGLEADRLLKMYIANTAMATKRPYQLVQ